MCTKLLRCEVRRFGSRLSKMVISMEQSSRPRRKPIEWLLGAPRRLQDKSLFHSIALVPLLAWVGLGGDGLSSSAYGPDEAFRALEGHRFLAFPLALAVALTVLLISLCYMRVIEKFPSGGGAYVVTSKLMGPRVGVVAACALLVDYVLTVSVSIAAGADALFSVWPAATDSIKVGTGMLAILVLVVLNIRGIKESVTALAPIFAIFVVSHIVLLAVGIGGQIGHSATVLAAEQLHFRQDLSGLGWVGLLAVLARAYSMGAGTFTGIEAVSNGLPALREPRIENGKRTMVYMSVSLALCAAGILICYVFAGVVPVPGKTMNAVLADKVFGTSTWGHACAVVTLAAEGALLFVAAQTGFMDGPRVMANMAIDKWLPNHFSNLSNRLTTQNGVVVMGATAAAILFFTGGDTHALVVLYSINVFLVFTLTTMSMAYAAWQQRRADSQWWRHALLHGVGAVICALILGVTLYEKLAHGAWLTVVITGGLVVFCFLVRRHYRRVGEAIRRLDKRAMTFALASQPTSVAAPAHKLDPALATAVILVNKYGGLGTHTMMQVLKDFPGHFKQMVFVGVATVDAHVLKDPHEMDKCQMELRGALQRYVHLARRLGVPASFEMAMGTEVTTAAVPICAELAQRFSQTVVFGGRLILSRDPWYQRLLHNGNAALMQRRLQECGVPMLIMPTALES